MFFFFLHSTSSALALAGRGRRARRMQRPGAWRRWRHWTSYLSGCGCRRAGRLSKRVEQAAAPVLVRATRTEDRDAAPIIRTAAHVYDDSDDTTAARPGGSQNKTWRTVSGTRLLRLALFGKHRRPSRSAPKRVLLGARPAVCAARAAAVHMMRSTCGLADGCGAQSSTSPHQTESQPLSCCTASRLAVTCAQGVRARDANPAAKRGASLLCPCHTRGRNSHGLTRIRNELTWSCHDGSRRAEACARRRGLVA